MNSIKTEIQHDSGVIRFDRDNLPSDAIGFAVGRATGRPGLVEACQALDLSDGNEVDYLIVAVRSEGK